MIILEDSFRKINYCHNQHGELSNKMRRVPVYNSKKARDAGLEKSTQKLNMVHMAF